MPRAFRTTNVCGKSKAQLVLKPETVELQTDAIIGHAEIELFGSTCTVIVTSKMIWLLFVEFAWASSGHMNLLADEDVISCGGRLYRVKFVPDHPNIGHFGNEEYKYMSVGDLIGANEQVCQSRPMNYKPNNQTIEKVRNMHSRLVFTFCEECGRCDSYAHMLLHRRVTRVADEARLDSVLILTPKPSLNGRNIPSTVVKLVQLNTRYMLSRTCALKDRTKNVANELKWKGVLIFCFLSVKLLSLT